MYQPKYVGPATCAADLDAIFPPGSGRTRRDDRKPSLIRAMIAGRRRYMLVEGAALTPPALPGKTAVPHWGGRDPARQRGEG